MNATARILASMFRQYADGQELSEVQLQNVINYTVLNQPGIALDGQMQAAGSDGVRANLGVLLELADVIAAVAVRLQAELPALRARRLRASYLLQLLKQAALVNTRLLRYVLPACGGRSADIERVLSAGAILPPAGSALAALVPSRMRLNSNHRMEYIWAFDGCLAGALFSMAEALAPAHDLPPQLEAPATLLAWLRQAAAAMGEISTARGLHDSQSLDGLSLCLAAYGAVCCRLPEPASAFCADPTLAGELALLTEQTYAVLPRWRCREEAGELTWSKLLEWAAAWRSMPWGPQHAAAVVARLASAAAALLQEEARRVQRLRLPHTAKGARKWQQVLEAVASLTAFMGLPGVLSGSSAMTSRQLFMTVAATGPRVARFAAALAGGQPPATALQEDGVAGALAGTLADWASAVQLTGDLWASADAPGNRMLRREAEAAALDLAASLVHLISGLPALAAALGPLRGRQVLQALAGALAALRCSMPEREDLFWSERDGRLPPLAAACCRLPHAIAGWSDADLERLGLAAAGDDQAGGGRLHTDASAVLGAAVACLLALRIGGMDVGIPYPDGGGGADDESDRDVACWLMQATAAMAAAGMPRADILAALHGLERSSAELAVEPQAGESAVLRTLAARLHGPRAARDHTPALLQRLLPADSGDDGGESAAAALAQPLPLEAALFRARALGRHKQCANVRCPTLPTGGDPPDLKAPKTNRCGGCSVVRYCSEACNRAAWREHKSSCLAMQAAAAAGGGEQ